MSAFVINVIKISSLHTYIHMIEFYKMNSDAVVKHLNTDIKNGLTAEKVTNSQNKYGKNVLDQPIKASLLVKVIDALLEPMMIILLIAFFLTLFINVIQAYLGQEFNFLECGGIAFAIGISVFLTLFMESHSEKAFNQLDKISSNMFVKVVRSGVVQKISCSSLVCGDIVKVTAGEKVGADCRILNMSDDFRVDESFLTGESDAVLKEASKVFVSETVVAEMVNMVFSGSLVVCGSADVVVTAVGAETELGKVASKLSVIQRIQTPLSQKLDRLGKIIALIGGLCAVGIFAFSFINLVATGVVDFGSVSQIFITSIVLIVAIVPEGLPTIVAVCLALNVIKMSKENALVKKMVACETLGSVSVICSDKTGTLTQNKMKVEFISDGNKNYKTISMVGNNIKNNIIINSSADIIYNNQTKNYDFFGSATECSMLVFCEQKMGENSYINTREKGNVVKVYPFSSRDKAMTTIYSLNGQTIGYMKGALERVLDCCNLSKNQAFAIAKRAEKYQQNGSRVLAFAHKNIAYKQLSSFEESLKNQVQSSMVFDGFVVISDPIRHDVKKAVSDSKKAGVSVKILTGDNMLTACAVGRELKIIDGEKGIYHVTQIDEMSDRQLDMIINDVKIVSRSTPETKLRIVQSLQRVGHVVAVTGDGVNDAPAILSSDVGIAMGVSGSGVCKEASDVVLLDDSFSTIIKSIKWGRGIYENLQRFILFQLTVNVSAVLITVLCILFSLDTPFNALQLLWVNLIMDGFPALSLALEPISDNLLKRKPLARNKPIITKNMAFRIAFFGIFISVTLFLQAKFNFMCISTEKQKTFIFCCFIFCQLFNAFNARILDKESIFCSFFANKPMLIIMSITFILQIFFVQACGSLFAVCPLSVFDWLKAVAIGVSVVVISEICKKVVKNIK